MIGVDEGPLARTWREVAQWLFPPLTERTFYLSERSSGGAGMFRQNVLCDRPSETLLSGVIDLSAFAERKGRPRHVLSLRIGVSLLHPLTMPSFDIRLNRRSARGGVRPLREMVGVRQLGPDRMVLSLKLQPGDLVAEALHLRWTAIGQRADPAREPGTR